MGRYKLVPGTDGAVGLVYKVWTRDSGFKSLRCKYSLLIMLGLSSNCQAALNVLEYTARIKKNKKMIAIGHRIILKTESFPLKSHVLF